MNAIRRLFSPRRHVPTARPAAGCAASPAAPSPKPPDRSPRHDHHHRAIRAEPYRLLTDTTMTPAAKANASNALAATARAAQVDISVCRGQPRRGCPPDAVRTALQGRPGGHDHRAIIDPVLIEAGPPAE